MSDLTPADVAADLGRPVTWVMQQIREGAIPGYKPAGGRFWRIDPDDYAAAKESWKAGSRPVDPNRIAPRSSRSQAALTRRKAS